MVLLAFVRLFLQITLSERKDVPGRMIVTHLRTNDWVIFIMETLDERMNITDLHSDGVTAPKAVSSSNDLVTLCFCTQEKKE